MSAQFHAAYDAVFGERRDASGSEHHELRRFVDDYCGCGPTETADHVDDACADAALMLAHQAAA